MGGSLIGGTRYAKSNEVEKNYFAMQMEQSRMSMAIRS